VQAPQALANSLAVAVNNTAHDTLATRTAEHLFPPVLLPASSRGGPTANQGDGQMEGWPEGIFSAPLTAFDATLTGSLGQRNGPGILGNPIPTKNFCAPPGLTGQPHNEAVSG